MRIIWEDTITTKHLTRWCTSANGDLLMTKLAATGRCSSGKKMIWQHSDQESVYSPLELTGCSRQTIHGQVQLKTAHRHTHTPLCILDVDTSDVTKYDISISPFETTDLASKNKTRNIALQHRLALQVATSATTLQFILVDQVRAKIP